MRNFIQSYLSKWPLNIINTERVLSSCSQVIRWKGVCILCQASTNSDVDLCTACESELPYLGHACIQCAIPLPEDSRASYCGACLQSQLNTSRVFSPFRYARPIDRLLTRLKFNHQLTAANVLGQLMAKEMKKVYQDTSYPDVLIPVPLHKKRLQERGFNQAVELAKPISRLLSVPLIYNACTRSRYTQPQTSLSAKERGNNLKNSFTVASSLDYEYVGLVDDVMTTGHTVFALSKALLKRGVKRIDIWCCARANLNS